MSISRFITNDIVTQQRIFGLSVYILISILLCCTIAEQKFLSSYLGRSSQPLNPQDEPSLSTAIRGARTISSFYRQKGMNIVRHHQQERQQENKNTAVERIFDGADTSATRARTKRARIISDLDAIFNSRENNDVDLRRSNESYYQRQKYHEVSPLLASNITLTDIGIRPQDPIRVFYSEDSMCHDTPPADLKIVSPPHASSSIAATSTTSNITPSKQNHHQQLNEQNNNGSNERIAVAIMVPQGDCSLEQKLGNIAIWYQKEDHPAVKVVLFYEPTVPPSSSASNNISNSTSASIRKKQQNYQPSFSKNIISDSSFVTDTIASFLISQRTATYFKRMTDLGNDFVDVRIVYPYYSNRTMLEHNLPKSMSWKEQIVTLISDIFTSMIVTVLSLIVTGMLLLLCWKDALSIEISRDGVLIISNATYVDDNSPLIQEQHATLSAEQVMGFPEVKFGSHSINTKTIRQMSPSCSTCIGSAPAITQPIQHHDSDEELHSTSIPVSGQQFDPEIKMSPEAEKLPYCCYNITCSICLEDFTKDETLRRLPCGHIFHTSCILPWLTKRATSCPLCKKCLCSYNKSCAQSQC